MSLLPNNCREHEKYWLNAAGSYRQVMKSRVSESAHSDEEEEAEQAAPAWPEYFRARSI